MTDQTSSTANAGLLPCPLCCSSNIQEGVAYVKGDTKQPAVRCGDCGCRATLKAWQSRVPAQGSRGCDDIAAERQRQIAEEGWTPAHDDEHTENALASAALCYVYASIFDPGDFPIRYWPWDWEWWKPSDARRNLVKAGALIAAEIDRIDRAAAFPSTERARGASSSDGFSRDPATPSTQSAPGPISAEQAEEVSRRAI